MESASSTGMLITPSKWSPSGGGPAGAGGPPSPIAGVAVGPAVATGEADDDGSALADGSGQRAVCR